MKQISTSALAKDRGLDPKDLFTSLKEKGWIFKKEDQWHLTKEGRMAGGEVKYNPQYGEYIVWPSNINLDQSPKKEQTFSSTDLGKQFEMSAQKINLILAELGWIERSQAGGWKINDSGQRAGGFQMEAQNGQPYVIWSSRLLRDKNFETSIRKAKGDYSIEAKEEENVGELADYRLKFPANYRTQDGHRVRSKAEAMIDDYLYRAGIVHAYERELPIEEKVICDFYIPNGKVYIEYWGLENDPKYAERKQKKLQIYSRENFRLIELTDSDIQNIDDTLPRKLRKYGINVDN